MVRDWSWVRWLAAVAATVASLLVIGVPTGVVSTPFYHRMTPVTWWDYPVWAVSGLLAGLVAATHVRSPLAAAPGGRLFTGGGLLSAFAVGCPICNKIVVALLGVSGALTLWAPVQPILGLLSVGLLAVALRARLRGERSCPALTLR